MTVETHSRPTAQRLIEATLALIEEQGSSLDVNLRQVSRRVGCAHTNAYNYFTSYDDLLWAAFRKALVHYGEFLIHDLSPDLPPDAYLRRVLTNLATYPVERPGLYRFVASDPIDVDEIPEDILVSVGGMKQWLFGVLGAVYAPSLSDESAERISNIVLAYIDGETLNLINGRVVPGEDVRGRVVENAELMIRELTGLPIGGKSKATASPNYPIMDLDGLRGAP